MVDLERLDFASFLQTDGSGKIIPPYLPTAVGSFGQGDFIPADQQFITETLSGLPQSSRIRELLDYIKLPKTLTATILSKLPAEST